MTTIKELKSIVIIGGGFAGIQVVRKLAGDKRFRITLIDRNNYFFFPPLIYQVATGFLGTSSISYPFRKLFREKNNIRFRMGELLKVDTTAHHCYLNNGIIPYDALVFATGAVTNYFGNKNIERHSIPMKTMNDALRMRNTLLQALEKASVISDPVQRKKLLTFVVAGGGPTGVEVAGMLAEIRKYIVARDYPELIGEPNEIYLVEGGPGLLLQMSLQSHRESYDALIRLGVKVKLNVRVRDFDREQIILSNGEIIASNNLVWAAGIIADVYAGIPEESLGAGKRMMTDPFHQVLGLKDVFAIGDISIQKSDIYFPNGHPQLAQVAIQQGRNLAANFLAAVNGKPLTVFRYRDRGSLAIIGRYRAVADLSFPRMHIGGFPALLVWLFVHLMSLLNYRNRMKTLYNWISAYLNRDQSLRMIVRPYPEKHDIQAKYEGKAYIPGRLGRIQSETELNKI